MKYERLFLDHAAVIVATKNEHNKSPFLIPEIMSARSSTEAVRPRRRAFNCSLVGRQTRKD